MTLLELTVVVLGALLVRVDAQSQCRPCVQSFLQSTSVSAGVENSAKTAVLTASLTSCVNLCNLANLMTLPTTSTCYMAEYNQNTFECILIKTCPTQSQMTNNTNKVIYVNPYCSDYIQVPAFPTVAMQLTLSCDFIPAVFGSAGLSGQVSISSDLLTYTSASPLNLIYFPYLDSNNRASRYLQVVSPASVPAQNSFKPFDVFGGSFTITLAFKVDGWLGDTPLVEFLGAASAQLCYTIRMGCTGGCIQAFFMADCACTSGNFYKAKAVINTMYWTHFTIAYDGVNTTYYINGTVYTFTASEDLNPSIKYTKNAQVTRLRVGTSECDWFNNMQTNYQGWIYCLNLYNYTLTQQQVGQLYTFCNSLRST